MYIKNITSIHNEAYKALLKLKQPRRQQMENVFLAEGARLFMEVVKAKTFTIQSVWLDEAMAEKLPKNMLEKLDCPVYSVSKEMLQKASDTVTSQGILAVRSTMGSVLHVPVCHVDTAAEAAALLKEAGFTVLAGHLKAEDYPYSINMLQPVAVMIGNEANGLSEEATKAADTLIKLPMVGQAESLNASVAAGVLLYEVVRQRISK